MYTFTSHVFVTGVVGFLIRCGLIKTRYFIGRESTLIFKRFSGVKLFLYREMYRIGYPAVDLLICQTDFMKEELIKSLPDLEKHSRIKVIPNPIDLGAVPIIEALDESFVRGSFLISAGRLIPEKGFDILIHVFKDLKLEFPELKLVILGEGKERENLNGLAEKYGLVNDIILKGFVTNVFPYFKAASVCVVSSHVEGFPNVLLQMMSQNTSVVSTKCAGGIDEIEGIYTAEPGSQEDLFRSIKQALTNDTTNRRPIFDRFLAERSIDRFVSEIEKELEKKI